MLRNTAMAAFLVAARAAYDSCDRPVAEWAGFNQAHGQGSIYAAVSLSDNVYMAGYQAGNFTFHSEHVTNGPTGSHGVDHTAVEVIHATGSHSDPDENGNILPSASAQNGWDAVVIKVDDAGVYQGIFAVDTMPADGKYNDSSLNSGWGGWSYFTNLDTFEESSVTDHMVGTGQFRGRFTFPGGTTLMNKKWQRYDAFVVKFNVDTMTEEWAYNGDGIGMPTCNTNTCTDADCTNGTPDKTCKEPTAVGGTVSTTSEGHVVATLELCDSGRNVDQGRVTLLNGADGTKRWHRHLGTAAHVVAETIGTDAFLAGTTDGTNIDPLMTGTTYNASKEVLIAKIDVSDASTGTEAPAWVKRFGLGHAHVIEADPDRTHLYVGGSLDEGPIVYNIDSCSLTGKYGGFLMKIRADTGQCVWATETPQVGSFSSRSGGKGEGLATDGNFVYTVRYTGSPLTFDDKHTLPNRGSGDDGYMAKYSCADGTGEWLLNIGGQGDDEVVDVAVSQKGPFVVGDGKSEKLELGDVSILNLQHARAKAEGGAEMAGSVSLGMGASFAMQLSNTERRLSCLESCDTGDTSTSPIKDGYCLIENLCVEDGQPYEFKPCFVCDHTISNRVAQGPRGDYCYIDDATCIPGGADAPHYQMYNQASVCEVCDPTKDAFDYSLKPGHFHDRDFANKEGGGCTGSCRSSSFNQISNYGVVFEMQSNGCQTLPTMEISPSISVDASLSSEDMALEAIRAIEGATNANKGAERAWALYHGSTGCNKASVTYVQGSRAKTHTEVCANTPAHTADVMGVRFGTLLYYGHSMARVKVQQGLAILKAELANGAAQTHVDDIKADTIAHILITQYQGLIHSAYAMGSISDIDKEAGRTNALAHWKVVQEYFPASKDKDDLASMFASSPTYDFYYCRLTRNLPASSTRHYGAADLTPNAVHHKTANKRNGGDSRPSLDYNYALLDVKHVDELQAAVYEMDEIQAYLSPSDIGTLAVFANNPPDCVMPPTTPPPTTPPPAPPKSLKDQEADLRRTAGRLQDQLKDNSLSDEERKDLEKKLKEVEKELMKLKEDDSSGLTDGEIAGIAVGATFGGIVILCIVGLILRSLIVKDAQPMFTCLEKTPAEKNPPA